MLSWSSARVVARVHRRDAVHHDVVARRRRRAGAVPLHAGVNAVSAMKLRPASGRFSTWVVDAVKERSPVVRLNLRRFGRDVHGLGRAADFERERRHVRRGPRR